MQYPENLHVKIDDTINPWSPLLLIRKESFDTFEHIFSIMSKNPYEKRVVHLWVWKCKLIDMEASGSNAPGRV